MGTGKQSSRRRDQYMWPRPPLALQQFDHIVVIFATWASSKQFSAEKRRLLMVCLIEATLFRIQFWLAREAMRILQIWTGRSYVIFSTVIL